jgi:hypothetical protein
MLVDNFDLDAYCHRIGYAGPREPTLPVLRSVVAGHATTIATVGEIDPQQLMGARAAWRSRRETADHPRGERLQREAERPKRGIQQPGLLIAISAAPPQHEFVLKRDDVDAHTASAEGTGDTVLTEPRVE